NADCLLVHSFVRSRPQGEGTSMEPASLGSTKPGDRAPAHATTGSPAHAETGSPAHAKTGSPAHAETGAPAHAKTGSLENPEVIENVPGRVIPILRKEFDDFDTESTRFLTGELDGE